MQGIDSIHIQAAEDGDFPWKCEIRADWAATLVYHYMREIDTWCVETLESGAWQTASVVWTKNQYCHTEYYFLTQQQAVLFQLRWSP